ncbi:hypothetical protein HK405_009516 [Cladochytrium tenue]|nr:hypothetical protein HK405_009516 [Cladochytrium tenue]
MSGSDLKELCRNAAMTPVREALRSTDTDIRQIDPKTLNIRAVEMRDFLSDAPSSSGAAQGPDGTIGGLDLD